MRVADAVRRSARPGNAVARARRCAASRSRSLGAGGRRRARRGRCASRCGRRAAGWRSRSWRRRNWLPGPSTVRTVRCTGLDAALLQHLHDLVVALGHRLGDRLAELAGEDAATRRARPRSPRCPGAAPRRRSRRAAGCARRRRGRGRAASPCRPPGRAAASRTRARSSGRGGRSSSASSTSCTSTRLSVCQSADSSLRLWSTRGARSLATCSRSVSRNALWNMPRLRRSSCIALKISSRSADLGGALRLQRRGFPPRASPPTRPPSGSGSWPRRAWPGRVVRSDSSRA